MTDRPSFAAALVHLPRWMRVAYVFAREGALGLVDREMLPPAVRPLVGMARVIERRNATAGGARLAAALTRLGPSYVKLGQFLATRADIVGPAVARDLAALQDRMPAFPQAEAEAMLGLAFGRPWRELFRSLSEPVAAASIAQVHRGVTSDGREVAVKVLRPGVRENFLADLKAMAAGAALAEHHSAEARRLRVSGIVATLARSVALEMDLRLEAAALSELAENSKDDPGLVIPAPDWERTARDVLTSDWIAATPLHDLAAIDAAGHDRVALSRTVIQAFLRHAIRDGFFHADMHQGNLLVDAKGDLVIVDCGIMGRLGLKERRFLAEILLGFITRDYTRVAEVHFEAGYVPPQHSVAEFAQAIRAIGEPIHDRRADQISMAKLLTLLFEITGLFDMKTRTELVMLQKTMVVVEGVARQLDPHLDMWRTAEPVVREWITHHLGPIGRLQEAGRGAASLAGALTTLPETLARGERVLGAMEQMIAHGVPLDDASLEGIGRAEARRNRAGTLALWVIAGLGAYALFWW